MNASLKRNGIAHVLDFPRAYTWFASCIGGDARATYAREYVKPVSGQRIIDIGCGPADIGSELPVGVEYVGFDASQQYIGAARTGFGKRGTFYCQSVSSDVASHYSRFDVAMANGVLHHLDDAQALELVMLGAVLACRRRTMCNFGRMLRSISARYRPRAAEARPWQVRAGARSVCGARQPRVPNRSAAPTAGLVADSVHTSHHGMLPITICRAGASYCDVPES